MAIFCSLFKKNENTHKYANVIYDKRAGFLNRKLNHYSVLLPLRLLSRWRANSTAAYRSTINCAYLHLAILKRYEKCSTSVKTIENDTSIE
jgi:hypothetical protein